MSVEGIVGVVAAVAASPMAIAWSLPLVSELGALGVRSRLESPDAPLRAQRFRLAFLVPAHNEAQMIEGCARSLKQMESKSADFDVYVVADNCEDRTAELARSTGVEALERRDQERRGKPWAIAWAMTTLASKHYDAFVIIDADTTVAPHFCDALVSRGQLPQKAIQAYFGSGNESESWLATLGGLLSRMRYEGQYPMKQRAGLNCPLTGNGMCLGSAWLEQVGWPTESLTENWELYARAAALGVPIEFAQDARLFSHESPNLAQAGIQRRRWQAGRYLVLRQHWSGILGSGRTSWLQKVDAIGELASPGPVLHALLATSLGGALLLLGGVLPRAVGALFLASIIPTLVGTILALRSHPHPGAVAKAFLRLPGYALWRIMILVQAIATGRRGEWVRSPRT